MNMDKIGINGFDLFYNDILVTVISPYYYVIICFSADNTPNNSGERYRLLLTCY